MEPRAGEAPAKTSPEKMPGRSAPEKKRGGRCDVDDWTAGIGELWEWTVGWGSRG